MKKEVRSPVIRLKNNEVILAVYGARRVQTDSKTNLSYAAQQDLTEGLAILLESGAKLYRLGGGWYRISGYGYRVSHALQKQFGKSLAVDERDTIRTLGFAL